MRVFSYCSSRRHGSKTKKIIDSLIGSMGEKADVNSSLYDPIDNRINMCRGCTSCFKGEACTLDVEDGFDKTKHDLLNADVVLLGTPVYACSVSGDMKVFIDRISYLLHLMPLRGKTGIPIITASSNSLIETNNYLSKIMQYLGLYVPFSVLCTVDEPNQFDSIAFENKLYEYAERIIGIHNGSEKRKASRLQETYFASLKNIYRTIGDKTSESRYWRDNNCSIGNLGGS